MRTPETDDSGPEEAATLADGFGTVAGDSGADGSGDTDFGEGAGGSTAAAQGAGPDPTDGVGETQAFPDPGDSATDTDLDLTGDGMVDADDFHAAVRGFFHFTAEDDGSPPGGHDPADPLQDASHDDGLFGLFGA